MSFGSFRSLFDQCLIWIDHLLMIALCVNGFSGFQEFIINNTALVPPDTKHDISSEAIWSWCWKVWLRRVQPWFSPLRAFKINPLFVTSQNSVQKLLSSLSLKQYFTSDFAMEICRSLKLCGTRLPILLIFPFARKRLLVLSCDTFNASANCCWVWVRSSSSAACIPHLRTLWSTRERTLFHIEIAILKLSKPCLTFSNQWSMSTISKLWLSAAFSFWLNKKSNAGCKCSFSGTNFDMISGRYNTDAIV
jgi:hypothetical protein